MKQPMEGYRGRVRTVAKHAGVPYEGGGFHLEMWSPGNCSAPLSPKEARNLDFFFK